MYTIPYYADSYLPNFDSPESMEKYYETQRRLRLKDSSKTAVVSGLVTDRFGHPVVGALAELLREGGNLVDRTFTDGSGFYYFPNTDDDPKVGTGVYIVRVTHRGVVFTKKTGAVKGELTQQDFQV